MKYESNLEALEHAIQKAGGRKKLCERLTKKGYCKAGKKLNESVIGMWVLRKAIPLDAAMLIQEMFGKPDRYDLKPENWSKK